MQKCKIIISPRKILPLKNGWRIFAAMRRPRIQRAVLGTPEAAGIHQRERLYVWWRGPVVCFRYRGDCYTGRYLILTLSR